MGASRAGIVAAPPIVAVLGGALPSDAGSHSNIIGCGGDRVASFRGRGDRTNPGSRAKDADLPFGGGKAVLQVPDGPFDRVALFRAFGAAVAKLGGTYITAEDVGTTIDDMSAVRERTGFVAGLRQLPGRAGGDPSPWTALGVFLAMQEAARSELGAELRDLTVAIQGTGHVGSELARLLAKRGTRLILADAASQRAEQLASELHAITVSPDTILECEADVFAPCALGGVLSAGTIPQLQAKLVCGGANNQLADDKAAKMLRRRGISYAPDYLVNAGGIINVTAEYLGESSDQVRERIEAIPLRLRELLTLARRTGQSSQAIADAMAERKMMLASTTAA